MTDIKNPGDFAVRAHDPIDHHATGIDCGPALAVCDTADLLVIATEWPEFAAADLTAAADRMRQPVALDLRGILPPDAAGLTMHCLGRPR